MAAKLTTGYEVTADGIRVWADIPKRRNGEHNDGALGRVLLALNEIQPEAFDPPEPAKHEPPVISHSVAAAVVRDLSIGETPAEDDEGPLIPGYRCANGACLGD